MSSFFRKKRVLEKKIRDLEHENMMLVSQAVDDSEEIEDLKSTITMLSYIACGRVGLTEDTKGALVKAVKFSKETCCPAEELHGGPICRHLCRHSCMDCWIDAAKRFKKEKSVFMIDNLRRW